VLWTSTDTKTGHTKEIFVFGVKVLEGHNSRGRGKQANAWTLHPEREDVMLL
jgi:hypothetical protein